MTSTRKFVLGVLCVASVGGVGLLQSACDLISGDGSGQTGTLQMLLTDAPFPFDVISEASVTITRIEVRQSSSGTEGVGEQLSDDTADSDDEDGDDIGNDGPDDIDEDESGDEDGDEVEDDDDTGEVSDGDSGATDGDEGKPGDTDTNPAQRQASQEDDDGDDADNADDDDGDDAESAQDDADDDDAEEDEGEDELDESANGEAGGGSFVTVFEGEATFNLLDLQGGVTASLASAVLSAGDYTQVRLIVSSGHVALTDGREFDLTVPSGEQTGIKLHFDFTITSAETTTLLVDMDVSKAFVPTPGGDINAASQIQSFLFKPSQSIRIVEVDAVGSISGVVLDDSGNQLANITVTVSTGGVDVTSSASTDDGSFTLSGLEPGSYDVTFSGTGFTDQTVTDIEVSAGTDAALGDKTLTADAGAT